MSQNLPSRLTQHFFSHLVQPFDSGAIVDRRGRVIHLRHEILADIGTLGPTAESAIKYFSPKKGDLVLLNDPYSGGTLFSTLSFVTALNNDLFLVARTGFRPNFSLAQKLTEEGLRIPPTPLAQNYQLNAPIVEAIASHPQAPEGLEARIKDVTSCIFAAVKQFELAEKTNPDLVKTSSIERYLERTQSKTLDLISEESYGETSLESELLTGELLKLKLKVASDGLWADFSGSKSSARMCLTDSASFASVAGALFAFLRQPIPINQGSLSLIHVITPLGSFLNAKFPSPTFLGATEGTSFVAQTVLRALKTISLKTKMADSTSLPLFLNFEFADKKTFFESIPGGTGASASGPGADALHFWVRNRLKSSIEEIERRFPLRVRRYSIRPHSGGAGAHRGGNGMIREYEILAPCTLSFLRSQEKPHAKGSSGASDGLISEIQITSKDGKQLNLTAPQGSLQIQSGDIVKVSSGGGGGYGKILAPT